MKNLLLTLMASAMISNVAYADTAISVGNPQDFYHQFNTADIPVEKMQQWPYYKYASANWDLTLHPQIGSVIFPTCLR